MAGSSEMFPLKFDINEDIIKVQTEVAKAMSEELRDTSPRSNNKGRHYATGWTFDQDGMDTIVYNKSSKAPLSFLLENPHLSPGGKIVREQPHIGPAFDKFGPIYDKKLSDLKIKPK